MSAIASSIITFQDTIDIKTAMPYVSALLALFLLLHRCFVDADTDTGK